MKEHQSKLKGQTRTHRRGLLPADRSRPRRLPAAGGDGVRDTLLQTTEETGGHGVATPSADMDQGDEWDL